MAEVVLIVNQFVDLTRNLSYWAIRGTFGIPGRANFSQENVTSSFRIPEATGIYFLKDVMSNIIYNFYQLEKAIRILIFFLNILLVLVNKFGNPGILVDDGVSNKTTRFCVSQNIPLSNNYEEIYDFGQLIH